jgi:hypothetical protein
MRPYKIETREDYVGQYTAYIYPDGHVESDPPERPKTQEDVQRDRRVAATRQRALLMLAADRARLGLDASTPKALIQSNVAVTPGKALFANYHRLLHLISTVSGTATSFPGETSSLLTTVGLGGFLVGPRAGKTMEYEAPMIKKADDESEYKPLEYRDPSFPVGLR